MPTKTIFFFQRAIGVSKLSHSLSRSNISLSLSLSPPWVKDPLSPLLAAWLVGVISQGPHSPGSQEEESSHMTWCSLTHSPTRKKAAAANCLCKPQHRTIEVETIFMESLERYICFILLSYYLLEYHEKDKGNMGVTYSIQDIFVMFIKDSENGSF